MNQQEILDERIETLRRRYLEEIRDAVKALNLEQERVTSGEAEEWGELLSLKELSHVLQANHELKALIFLKDRIANQVREKGTTP